MPYTRAARIRTLIIREVPRYQHEFQQLAAYLNPTTDFTKDGITGDYLNRRTFHAHEYFVEMMDIAAGRKP